jgi:hypothetical protein
MFYPVMEIQVSKIKGVFPVVALQHVRGEVGNKEAEAGCEVVCGPDFGTELVEFDVFAIMRENTWRSSLRVLQPLSEITRNLSRIEEHAPWLANALSAGHEHRLSPS